ncbi:MAG: V-type ATP synthase subunit F [Actinomycetota bacterium]|nr:V-type ATP synthase subunit F [Actinomycetota bacterium]
MYKVVILTDHDTACGFRLAGVDVREAENPSDAQEKVRLLLSDEETGILAVNEGFMEVLDEQIKEQIEKSYRPIVVSLPVREKLGTTAERRAFLSRLVHRAVGFDVTLKQG